MINGKDRVGKVSSEKRLRIRYYWCVNCGNTGDFGKVKERGLKCEECSYDAITEYTKEEYLERKERVQ